MRHIFVLQTGLPPTYEEYLYHKYAMMSRSHTPPPPWSDSTTMSSSNPTSSIQPRRELLASQPELREYLTQLTQSDRNSQYQYQYQQQRQQSRDTISVPREQQVRVQQRTRAMPLRWVVEQASKDQPRLVSRGRYRSRNNSRSFPSFHMWLRHRWELAWLGILSYPETFQGAEN